MFRRGEIVFAAVRGKRFKILNNLQIPLCFFLTVCWDNDGFSGNLRSIFNGKKNETQLTAITKTTGARKTQMN